MTAYLATADNGLSRMKNIFTTHRGACYLTLISLALSLIAVIYKYLNFEFWDWDLAFFTQSAWNLVHGSQYSSVVGINYFGDHSYYITFLTLPFLAIAPTATTLLVLKAIGFALTGACVYAVVWRILDNKTSALTLAFLFLIFPPNVFALLYEFNPENFAAPILLLMYLSFRDNRALPFMLWSLLLLSIKENMALIVIAFGIFALFAKEKKKGIWAGIPIVTGSLVFVLFVFFLIPYFRELDHHAFTVRYDHLGSTPTEILSNGIMVLVHPLSLGYLVRLFGPLALPAILQPHYIFLVVPLILQHMLSSHGPERTIYCHYGLTITPFIFIATAHALRLWRDKFSERSMRLLGVTLTSLCVIWSGLYVSKLFVQVKNPDRDNPASAKWELIGQIPHDASVIATFEYLAPLATRRHLYSFHKIYDDKYQDEDEIRSDELYVGKTFELPAHVEYALINHHDPMLKLELNFKPSTVQKRITNFFAQSDWIPIAQAGTTILYQKGNRSAPSLGLPSMAPGFRHSLPE